MKIGANSFGLKFRLYDDFEGTLHALKQAGFDSLEPCVVFTPGKGSEAQGENAIAASIPADVLLRMSGGIWPCEEAPARLKKVRDAGLAVISVHMFVLAQTPEDLESAIPQLVAFGKEHGIQYYVLSLNAAPAAMKAYVPSVEKLSDALAGEGITLCYHNHETECREENGETALDVLFGSCPNLSLELDVGWAQFAGLDPVELMRKYRDRIRLLHLKDIRGDASPETRETCFTAIGEGSIPLRQILEEAARIGLGDHQVIIDQDDSQTDIVDDLRKGIRNIRKAEEI